MTQATFIPGLSNRNRGTQNGRSLMWKSTGDNAVLASVPIHPYAMYVEYLCQLRQHHWDIHIVAKTT